MARAATTGLQTDRRYDVVIRGGLVIDGTGQTGLTDLVIDRGRIAFMGTVPKTIKATHTIDARGKVVTPGFIDAHAHTPPHALAHHALSMGVTSIVVGQDAESNKDVHVVMDFRTQRAAIPRQCDPSVVMRAAALSLESTATSLWETAPSSG